MGRASEPVFLLPNVPVSGSSVEHFYHFLLSYLLPIDEYLLKHDPGHIVVRDCGPMNAWFDLLPSPTRVDVVTASELLERSDAVLLKTFEIPSRFRRRRISRVCRRLQARLGIDYNDAERETVLIERLPPDSFFEQQAENLGSGASRRSIENFDTLHRELARVAPVRVFHGERLSPADQVRLLSKTDLLIGQHGAGLANMVWMPRGSLIVEILPRNTGLDLAVLFRDLARNLGHEYMLVEQESDHAMVNIADVLTHVRINRKL